MLSKKRLITLICLSGKKSDLDPIDDNKEILDSITNIYSIDAGIWGYTTSLKPQISSNQTYFINLNFSGTSSLYYVAIGITEQKINEEYKATEYDINQINDKYLDILSKGYFFTFNGISSSLYNKGVLNSTFPNFRLFNPGDQCYFNTNVNNSTLEVGAITDVLETFTGINISNLYLTLLFIKKEINEALPLYISITPNEQTQVLFNQGTGTVTFQPHQNNYGYVFCFPNSTAENSGKYFDMT